MKKIKIILRAKEKDGTDMHPHTRRQIKKQNIHFKKKGGGRKRMDGSWIRQLELSHVVGSFRPHPNADWRLSDIAASKSWPALPPQSFALSTRHIWENHTLHYFQREATPNVRERPHRSNAIATRIHLIRFDFVFYFHLFLFFFFFRLCVVAQSVIPARPSHVI